MGTFEYSVDFVTKQWNIAWRFAVRGGCEQADESSFATYIAVFVVDLNADVVQIGVAVNRRTRVGLGENELVF